MEELRFSDYCANCRESLANIEKLLFVEKEVGRCFCSEDCIKEYFQPTVDLMEDELRKLRSHHDIPESEFPRFAHYRQLALEDPDEVWLERVENGECHFTFIMHFRHGEERMSYVVRCLAIDGVPSFVFLNFPTRDEDLVDEYRRGTDMRVSEEPQLAEVVELPNVEEAAEMPASEEHEKSALERLYLELRQPGDIPPDLFDRFEPFIEPTVDDPDEIWQFTDDDKNEWCTFITRHVVDLEDSPGNGDDEELEEGPETEEFVMIVVCDKKLDVVFAFPTIDPAMVQHFRKGINSLNKTFGVGWARGRAA